METDLDTLKRRLADVEREMNMLAEKQAMSQRTNPALQKELDALRYEASDLRAQIERLSASDFPPVPDLSPEADSPQQVRSAHASTAQVPPIIEATESAGVPEGLDLDAAIGLEEPGIPTGSSVAPEDVASDTVTAPATKTVSPPPPTYPLSPSARRALAIAQAVSRLAGEATITTLSMLVGLSREENGATAALLTAFGFPPARFLHWMEQKQGWTLSAEGLQSAGKQADDPAFAPGPFSDNARQVMDAAAARSKEKQASVIRSRHILLALLTHQPNRARSILEELGVPLTDVQAILSGVPEEAAVIPAMFAYSANSAFADIATDRDALGFEMHAQALAEIIVKPETVPPLVIGIYGPWGSGKSTFMALVKKYLEDWDARQHPPPPPGLRGLWQRLFPPPPNKANPHVVCVEFNAWAYTDAEKLWTGLVEKISPYLDRQLAWWQKPFFWLGRSAWRFIGSLVLGLFPIVGGIAATYILSVWEQARQWEVAGQIATWLASFAASIRLFSRQEPLTRSVASLMKQYDASETQGVMNDIQAEIQQTVKSYFQLSKEEPPAEEEGTPRPDAEKMRQRKLKVVVLIDELDRCPLEKIVDILEAIKIFLAEEIFIVLMAVDTRVIAEAIRLHYQDVRNPSLAREYLEKIIQIIKNLKITSQVLQETL